MDVLIKSYLLYLLCTIDYDDDVWGLGQEGLETSHGVCAFSPRDC